MLCAQCSVCQACWSLQATVAGEREVNNPMAARGQKSAGALECQSSRRNLLNTSTTSPCIGYTEPLFQSKALLFCPHKARKTCVEDLISMFSSSTSGVRSVIHNLLRLTQRSCFSSHRNGILLCRCIDLQTCVQNMFMCE